MTDDSGQTAAEQTPPKKRGPKSRAEIEAEIRAQVAEETRAAVEAEVRAEYEQRELEAARETERLRAEAADSRPISGAEISDDPSVEGAVTINFVEDGMTVLGKLWYRGETLTLTPGTPNWDASITSVKKGSAETICFALMDEDQQIAKWGKRYFRPGPWKGKSLEEIAVESAELTDAERAQLEKAQREHERRYGPVNA